MTTVMQKVKQMTLSEFKGALQNHEENEKSCNKGNDHNRENGVKLLKNGHQIQNKF